MVRLKDELQIVAERVFRISIPYGAIKREPCNRTWLPAIISIPYGAIKRISPKFVSNNLGEFQFLMVRLKECTSKLMPPIINISIPYGAIKSFLTIFFIFFIFLFQFLMVRLKGI